MRRTWAPRGKTPLLHQIGRRHGKVSAIAALTIPPRRQRVGLYFSLHTGKNITAPRVVSFLRSLRRQLQRTVFIVWDRSLTHRAGTVNRLFVQPDKLQRFFLPPYAPEINPVEMLWSYLKSNPLANYAPSTPQKLSGTTRYHAAKIRHRPGLLRSFLYATPLFLPKIGH